jgi:isopenicillin-N N-acyltransferase-like protein
MSGRPLRVLELLSDDSLTIGHQHGETFRREIADLAEIRMERMCAVSHYKRVKDVLALAEKHLAPLQDFDVDLFLELRGIAEASNVSLERLVVLNHYTDLRDIVPNTGFYAGRRPENSEDIGGCSIIFSPTPKGPMLGQTWDIHGSAEPYVLMLKVQDALVFSIVGCLGMTGINKHGVAIALNNLSSFDARIGVLWPALVRKALTHDSAKRAKEEIINAPNGSGRHYAIADEKHFFGIETSGTKKKIICDDPNQVYFHTNHCLDPEMRKTHAIRKDSNTLWRFQHLDEVTRTEDLSSAENIFLAFKPISMTPEKSRPHKTTTCGTLVMDINKRMVLGCAGIADEELLKYSQTRLKL